MGRKEQEQIFYDQLLLTEDVDILDTVNNLLKALQGVEVTEATMSLAVLLLMILHKNGLSYTDVLGMADCMVYPESRDYFPTEVFSNILERI